MYCANRRLHEFHPGDRADPVIPSKFLRRVILISMESNTFRPLGNSGLKVSAVALGCWPIAGVTTLGANDADSIATIRKCFDVGVNHLDTAHVYGPNGESENLIRRVFAGASGSGPRRDELVIATKCG